MNNNGQPEGYKFNELLCVIAAEYAEKFGYTLKKDSVWNKETESHPISAITNTPLREMEFEGVSDNADGKYPPYLHIGQRFGNLRINMYYPKDGNKGRLAFVGLEFHPDGTFAEAQVFYEPGVKLFPELLAEVQKRWEEVKLWQKK
jgi:hypothetical protein